MNYDQFLRNNLIKKVGPNAEQIRHQLKRSEQDLETAQANLSIDPTWSLTIAYHAMIRSCRALMHTQGYLPTAYQTHKTLVEFAKAFLGKKYSDLVAKLNRLRRRRHNFIYDAENHVNPEEAKSALDAAKELITEIKKIVRNSKEE
jgi:uncharacterized protein (UPF0332 family)